MKIWIKNLPEDTVVIETVHCQPGKRCNRCEINNIAYAYVKYYKRTHKFLTL